MPSHSQPESDRGDKKRVSRRRKTAHLKQVPDRLALREEIRDRCYQICENLDKSRPLSKDEMEQLTRALLQEMNLPESYIGWTMVMMTSAFWRDQVSAIPPERRLFLLPHCLKHAEGCPAEYDQFGLDCKTCGACSIADYRGQAEELGYRVLVAEGSPIVMKILVSGYVDAVVGVACLNVLEKAFDKILLAGIPCMAVPLHSSDCRNTSVDEKWVFDMIHLPHREPQQKTATYVHLMRAAQDMFAPQNLNRLIAPQRQTPETAEANLIDLPNLDPIAATERLAIDFVGRGGKYSRPFTTLAVYDALTGGHGTTAEGAAHVADYSDSVKRAALAIETFHKASLVHDDIEDDDEFRYGEPTVHRQFGVSTGINLGDYMIGLGYRLVSREIKTLGAEVVAKIVDQLAEAHMRLSEGQGAELMWRDSTSKELTPIDALKIYALKTSPAFEAALHCGIALAQTKDDYRDQMRKFARHVGVAFQILNDLKDWFGDSDNKLSAGNDIIGGRPTVLWALALQSLKEDRKNELIQIANDPDLTATAKIQRVRTLYLEGGVFDAAEQLVEKYRAKAEEIADEIEPEAFRRLLYYLVDSILETADDHKPTIVIPTTSLEFPIAAPTS
ncbi:polyprenyl synthetase family protein [Bremerella sp. JC817]|uniref:polyprenyl synthetase family protein n=1 Tax=Bremerella sp. JC817 TaxID=3231756 RepID=UPI00345A2FD4